MARARREDCSPRPPEWTRRAWRRGALLERLSRGHARIVLVRGPSGSGKTAVLAQAWEALTAEGRIARWLALPPPDSLDAAEEPLGAALADARCTDLFLDGYERLAGHPAERTLRRHLETGRAPRLWIGSRVAPKLPIAAARSRRELLELGPRELAFSTTEIAAAAQGLLTEPYVRFLERQTDGVPVAVELALRSLAEGGGDLAAPAWEEQLSAYYREQILAGLPAEEQAFLGRMVIVELFDVSLAQAITGPAAGRLIEKLYREDGLLIRDRRSRLFHLPAGLRSCLAAELEWLDEETRARLHASAARWFERRGLYAEAAMHALAAQDGARAGALIGRLGSAALNARFSLERIERSLAQLSEEAIRVHPSLSRMRALVRCQHRPAVAGAVAALPAPGAAADTGGATPDAPDSAINELFLRSYADQPAPPEVLARCLEIAAEFATDDLVARGLARNLLCWHDATAGRLASALRWADLAMRDYVAADALYAAVHMHLHRATILFWRNAPERAREECTLAERAAQLFFPEDERLRSLAWIYRAAIDAELGAPPAERELAAMLEYVQAHEELTEALVLIHRLAVRASIRAGRMEDAEDVLARGLALAAARDNQRLLWTLGVEHVALLARGGRLEEAAAQARRLGLDGLGAEGAHAARPWIDVVEGLACHARLAMQRGEHDAARRSIAALRSLASRLDLPRAATLALLLEARLEARQGRLAMAAELERRARQELAGEPALAFALDDGALVAAAPAASDPVATLTAREQQLMRLLAQGLHNKQLAHSLELSEATIKFHIRNIYRKLGARNRVQAIARLRHVQG